MPIYLQPHLLLDGLKSEEWGHKSNLLDDEHTIGHLTLSVLGIVNGSRVTIHPAGYDSTLLYATTST